jgi:hypothetical protein
MTLSFLRLGATGVAAALLLTGCGHKNANATCGDYKKFSADNRIKTVKSLLKAHNQSDSTLNIDTTRASVTAYCFLHGSSSKISGIYGG